MSAEDRAMVSPDSLITEYGQMVTAICRKMIQDREVARDAAQEVWYQVLKSLPSFQGRSQISTWLYTITRRVVLDYATAEKRYTLQFLRGYFHGEDREAPMTDEYERQVWIKDMCDKCLTGMLHCLSNEARLMYILKDMVGLPYTELAEVYELTGANIRQIVSRSRNKLNSFLRDECVLYNPQGSCNCRMKKLVLEIDLPEEYAKIRTLIGRVNVFMHSEQNLPEKNFWEKFI